MARKPVLQIPTMTPEQRGFVDDGATRTRHNVVERAAALPDAGQHPETLHDAPQRRAASGSVAERPATPHNVVERSAASEGSGPAPRGSKATVVWASGEERRRRTVYLRPEVDDALEAYRKANRYPVSELVEKAVVEYLRAVGALE